MLLESLDYKQLLLWHGRVHRFDPEQDGGAIRSLALASSLISKCTFGTLRSPATNQNKGLGDFGSRDFFFERR
jgi:hypothetical protein